MSDKIAKIKQGLEMGKSSRQLAYETVNERIEDALEIVSSEFRKALEFGLLTALEIRAVSQRIQDLRKAQNVMKYRV